MTTAELFAIDDADVPPMSYTDSEDEAPLRCEVDGCGNTVELTPTGRRPRKMLCPVHKGTTTAAKSTPGKRNGWSAADQVEEALCKYFEVLPIASNFVQEPFSQDLMILSTGGPAVIHEIVELAKQDKKMRVVLERLAMPGKYGPLAMAIVGGIILPVILNHNPQLLGALGGEGVNS